MPAAGGSSDRQRYWKANLLGASIVAFMVQAGYSVANPLLPAYLHRELGIDDPGRLALWSGLAAAVSPFVSAVASPIWGSFSDRFGRRNLLVRAVTGAAVCTAALGLVQNAFQLMLVRTANGVAAGVQVNALSLVASETPQRHLARAIGILMAARSLSQTVGPAIGGVAGSLFPLRAVFAVSGLVMLASVGPILLKVRETARPPRGSVRPSALATLRSSGADVRRAIVALIATQALAQCALAGAQQLILVRIIELEPGSATLGGGLAVTGLSLTATLTGIVYPRALPALGYRRLAIASTLVLGAAILGAALATSVPWLVAITAIAGIGYGAHTPATASMLGIEAPGTAKGTIFGLASSGQQFGFGVGALGTGIVAAVFTTAGGLLACTLAAAAAGIALALWGREPPSIEHPAAAPEPKPAS